MTELNFARIGQLERDREGDDAFVPEIHQERMADAMARINPYRRSDFAFWGKNWS